MDGRAVVHLLHADGAVRARLQAGLEARGCRVSSFVAARALAQARESADCLFVDWQLAGGLQHLPPFVALVARGAVGAAVEALQAGALDVLETPLDGAALEARLEQILRKAQLARQTAQAARAASRLLERLTPREHVVLEHLMAGQSNKMTAHALGISPRTVEVHRARIMDKVEARTLPGLMRIALTAEPLTLVH